MTRAARIETRRVLIRGLVVSASIGAYTHERNARQPVRIDVEIDVDPRPVEDTLGSVVSYDGILDGIRARAAGKHVQLAETLGDGIADDCLADPRIHRVRVRVEKLEAVANAAGVGAEVVKSRIPPGDR